MFDDAKPSSETGKIGHERETEIWGIKTGFISNADLLLILLHISANQIGLYPQRVLNYATFSYATKQEKIDRKMEIRSSQAWVYCDQKCRNLNTFFRARAENEEDTDPAMHISSQRLSSLSFNSKDDYFLSLSRKENLREAQEMLRRFQGAQNELFQRYLSDTTALHEYSHSLPITFDQYLALVAAPPKEQTKFCRTLTARVRKGDSPAVRGFLRRQFPDIDRRM